MAHHIAAWLGIPARIIMSVCRPAELAAGHRYAAGIRVVTRYARDNDSIRHAARSPYLKEHPRLELQYGARSSPHDNPAGNHASDQHHGPIDRVQLYPYRSSQDRVEAV